MYQSAASNIHLLGNLHQQNRPDTRQDPNSFRSAAMLGEGLGGMLKEQRMQQAGTDLLVQNGMSPAEAAATVKAGPHAFREAMGRLTSNAQGAATAEMLGQKWVPGADPGVLGNLYSQQHIDRRSGFGPQGYNVEQDPDFLRQRALGNLKPPELSPFERAKQAAEGRAAGTPPTDDPVDDGNPWTTDLRPSEQAGFEAWKKENAPDDSGHDYDLRGAFRAGLKRGPDGHMPDTFKMPNHPTFSNESMYAPKAPEFAGHWKGEEYVPPKRRQPETPAPRNIDPNSPEGIAAAEEKARRLMKLRPPKAPPRDPLAMKTVIDRLKLRVTDPADLARLASAEKAAMGGLLGFPQPAQQQAFQQLLAQLAAKYPEASAAPAGAPPAAPPGAPPAAPDEEPDDGPTPEELEELDAQGFRYDPETGAIVPK